MNLLAPGLWLGPTLTAVAIRGVSLPTRFLPLCFSLTLTSNKTHKHNPIFSAKELEFVVLLFKEKELNGRLLDCFKFSGDFSSSI